MAGHDGHMREVLDGYATLAGRSADVLRSQTPEGVRKELAACVAALNIVRTIMLEAAIEHRKDPMRLSFVAAVRAILSFAPILRAIRDTILNY